MIDPAIYFTTAPEICECGPFAYHHGHVAGCPLRCAVKSPSGIACTLEGLHELPHAGERVDGTTLLWR